MNWFWRGMKTACAVRGAAVVGVAGRCSLLAGLLTRLFFIVHSIVMQSRRPSPMLEDGPVRPFHHSSDTRSVVVAI